MGVKDARNEGGGLGGCKCPPSASRPSLVRPALTSADTGPHVLRGASSTWSSRSSARPGGGTARHCAQGCGAYSVRQTPHAQSLAEPPSRARYSRTNPLPLLCPCLQRSQPVLPHKSDKDANQDTISAITSRRSGDAATRPAQPEVPSWEGGPAPRHQGTEFEDRRAPVKISFKNAGFLDFELCRASTPTPARVPAVRSCARRPTGTGLSVAGRPSRPVRGSNRPHARDTQRRAA